MPVSAKSSVTDNLKPINVFYVWYAELCRRYNSSPLSIVKPAKPKKETILDFFGDRIKAEEWLPILNALRKDTSLHVIAVRSRAECEFFHDVDTEQKLRRMKRRYGSLRTDFILKTLLKSMSCVLKNSQVLTCLELDGLPISKEYLRFLISALENNKTVRKLSLKHCPIRDDGCELLCRTLRFTANIEVLNLSGCGLSVTSAFYLSKLISYQQTKRYCECWHNSLRYEDPEAEIMYGLKRLTLNSNPEIGDEGLGHLLDVLADDLWIRALDMQQCNISDNLASRILQVINYNRSLQIVDLRHNPRLSSITLDKIFDNLKQKQQFDYNNNDFQWCLTTSTLSYSGSFCDDVSNNYERSISPTVQKSRSAPTQQNEPINSASTLMRTKTIANIKRSRQKLHSNRPQKDYIELNTKLKEEMSKRKQVEQINSELQKKLEQIKSVGNLHSQPSNKVTQCIKLLEDFQAKDDQMTVVNKPSVKVSPMKQKKIKDNKIKTNSNKDGKNIPLKFVFSPTHKDSAQNIFENFLLKNGCSEADDDEIDVNFEKLNNPESKTSSFFKYDDDETDLTASNASLLRLVEEISKDETPKATNERRPVVSSNKADTSWVKVR